jgi:capsular polysaccharide transport system ATP-binding protein
MTVSLQSVSKWTGTARGQHRLFEDLNIELEDGDRTALLGTSRTGKSTVLALLCGSTYPDSGVVMRNRRISWPLPGVPSLDKSLTGINNIRFLARLYAIDEESYIERIRNFTGIGDLLNDRLRFWPKKQRNEFTIALGLCIDFDVYLFDDKITSGDKELRRRCDALITSLDESKSIFFATQVGAMAARYCSQAYVLHEGRALFFPAIADAIAFYEPLCKGDVAVDDEAIEDDREDEDEEVNALF